MKGQARRSEEEAGLFDIGRRVGRVQLRSNLRTLQHWCYCVGSALCLVAGAIVVLAFVGSAPAFALALWSAPILLAAFLYSLYRTRPWTWLRRAERAPAAEAPAG